MTTLAEGLMGAFSGGAAFLLVAIPVILLLGGSATSELPAGAVAAAMGLGSFLAGFRAVRRSRRTRRAELSTTQVAPAGAQVLKHLDESVLVPLRTSLDASEPSASARELATLVSSTREALVEGFESLRAAHGEADLSAYVDALELVEELKALVEEFESERVRAAHADAEISLAAREAGLPDASFATLLGNLRDDARATRARAKEAAEVEESARAELSAHLDRVRPARPVATSSVPSPASPELA